MVVKCQMRDIDLDGQVLMNTTVHTDGDLDQTKLKCLSTTNEAMRIWLDGDLVILWSCVNYSKGFHDQAVALLQDQPHYPNYTQNPLDTQGDEFNKRLKKTSIKYLSRELVESIDWQKEKENRESMKMKTDLFVCRVDILRISTMLGGYLLVFVFLVVIFRGNYEKVCKKSGKRNQVAPYVI